MTILRQSRRRFLQSAAASGAALLVPQLIRPVLAQVPAGADLGASRDKIEHIVVIFQENRASVSTYRTEAWSLGYARRIVFRATRPARSLTTASRSRASATARWSGC